MEFILKCLPLELKRLILNHNIAKIEEIRVRCGREVILQMGSFEIVIKYVPQHTDIIRILQNICNNSVYAYQNQIANGFITVDGGSRVGISGNVVLTNGQVSNISHVYSLNFRIAHQVLGSCNEILKCILNTENNSIFSALIVSPPGCGKTTIIRDLARTLSNGIPEINFKGVNVCIVDERGEIAGLSRGVPSSDVGTRTDILDNVPKCVGIRMAVRSLAPKVVIADEIGNSNDAEVVNYATCSGVKCVFTAHGSCMDDLLKNRELRTIVNLKLFERIIFLDETAKGKVKQIVNI